MELKVHASYASKLLLTAIHVQKMQRMQLHVQSVQADSSIIVQAIPVILAIQSIAISAQKKEHVILAWTDSTEKPDQLFLIHAKNVWISAKNVVIILPAQNAMIVITTTKLQRDVMNAKAFHTVCSAQTMDFALNVTPRNTSLRITYAQIA